MTRVDARALATYVGGLEQGSAQLDELAQALPRVFTRDEHVASVRGATDPLLEHARAGVAQLHGTPYEASAWSAFDDLTRAVAELDRPSRSAVRAMHRDIDATIARTRDELDATRRATFDADLDAGGDAARAATDELVASIDALVQPGARVDGADAQVAGDALASSSWRLPARPELPGIGDIDTLVRDAVDDPRSAFDLQRVLAAWRPTLVDEYVPGTELAERAAAIAGRGADDLAPEDWRELVRLADADPAGAFVRMAGPREELADVAFSAMHDMGERWRRHVVVEGMSLALARADADLGVLRREARALLRRGTDEFGDREWARLAELARLDPSYRVLPTRGATGIGDAIADSLALERRVTHPNELTPNGRYYGDHHAKELAEHWRGHLFGVGANLRMRLLDGGLDAAIRGSGRLEEAAGGFTGDVTFASRGEAARYIAGVFGKATARGIADGIRKGVHAINPPRISAAELDSALLGGPIPERLTLGDLRRFEQWRDATNTERVSLLARMVARHDPTSMSESRTLVRQARKLPIDESTLSPGLRQRWREARALVDREDRSLRAVGEYREGYEGHADYANLGRLRSTLELIGTELAVRAQVERQALAATHAASEPAAAAASSLARTIDDAAMDAAPVDPIDEILTW